MPLRIKKKVGYNMGFYNVILIDPRPASKEAMIELLKNNAPVVGVEFTLPALSQYIDANIDGQHIAGGNGKSAIELAVEVELPARGTTLAIVRPDADALGAIAVLNCRREDELGHIGDMDNIYGRVPLIAEHDKFSQGSWSGSQRDFTEDDLTFAALGAIAAKHTLPIATRVQLFEDYLCTEDCVGLESARHQILDEREKCANESNVSIENGIAVVESHHRGATELGYQYAPVVVIRNDAFRFPGVDGAHVKYTVCQWQEGYVDFSSLIKDLNEVEESGGTWGGSKTIAGSPQGVSSSLNMDQVASLVKSHKSN